MATDKGYTSASLSEMWDDAKRESKEIVASALAVDTGPEPLSRYQENPLGFLVEQLGIPEYRIRWALNEGYAAHQWDGTPEPLLAIMDGLVAWENVAVESATGTGKSFISACLILWFLSCWRGARVFTFASKGDQLEKYIWAEIGKLWPRFIAIFPDAELNHLALYVDGQAKDRDSWAAFGISTAIRAGEQISSKAAGMHAEHMLLVTEETQGIAPSVIAAHENTCTAPHNLRLAIGNPDSKLDPLHGLYKRPSWRGIRISALDHPNVVTGDSSIVPGAVSPKSILARLELYQSEEHELYLSRVRGIPPDQSQFALIHLAWIEAAVVRAKDALPTLKDKRWPQALGADPSQSESGDFAGLAHFIGPICVSVAAQPCPNATDFGRQVWQMAKRLGVPPQHIGIDPIGVGAAAVNVLRELIPEGTSIPRLESGGKPVARIAKGGERPGWSSDANLFRNLRAQMYWQLREDLQRGVIGLPDDLELHQELITPTFTEQGKTTIEDKADVRARLGRSPNKADAVVYANWVRPRTTPLDLPTKQPDVHSLGFKRVNGKVMPRTAEDVHRTVNPVPQPAHGAVRKWW